MSLSFFLVGLSFFFANFSRAELTRHPYYPKSFYEALEKQNLRDKALVTTLHQILSARFENLGYKKARTVLFGFLHLEKIGAHYAIKDVYCNTSILDKDLPSEPPGPGKIPSNNVLNVEHTWPQSRFSKSYPKDIQKSDLHHLYPTLSFANSSRGNIEFANVVRAIDQPCPDSRKGYADRQSGKVFFEVPDNHKGNAARSIFYFSIRYRLPINWTEESTLKDWSRQDPVDEFEQWRHEQIADQQIVRNPFVDYPELADLISDF